MDVVHVPLSMDALERDVWRGYDERAACDVLRVDRAGDIRAAIVAAMDYSVDREEPHAGEGIRSLFGGEREAACRMIADDDLMLHVLGVLMVHPELVASDVSVDPVNTVAELQMKLTDGFSDDMDDFIAANGREGLHVVARDLYDCSYPSRLRATVQRLSFIAEQRSMRKPAKRSRTAPRVSRCSRRPRPRGAGRPAVRRSPASRSTGGSDDSSGSSDGGSGDPPPPACPRLAWSSASRSFVATRSAVVA